MDFPGGSVVKNPPDNAGDSRDVGSTRALHGSERAPGEGNGNPLQYSCLEKSMDREAWWAIVHGVTKRHKGACMTHHHKGIVQSAFPALKILCALLPLPNPLASTDLLMVSIVVLLICFNK